MPYTKSPTQDTYSSEEIDLIKEINARAGSPLKDEDYVNVFVEPLRSKASQDSRSFLIKRAGSGPSFSGPVNGTIRGSIYWIDKQTLFYCIGTTVYMRNYQTNTTTSTVAFTSTTGTVGFAEFLYNNGTAVIVASDGSRLVTITSAGVVTICTDPDLPSSHDPNIVFFDGYIFLAHLNTGEIWNSAQNDPLTWDSTFFIYAEIEADTVVRLGKINNYLIAFGTETIEYFFDAGNATGSPLQRNDTPVKKITYLSGFAQQGNDTFFVGEDYNGDIQVYKMTDFKAEPISTYTISKYLNSLQIDYTQWYGNFVSFQGHIVYVLNAGSYTYCYDTETNLWTRLAYQQNENFNILRSHGIKNNTGFANIFCLNDGTANWYVFNENLYQDSGVNFNCIVVTESNDFGTLYRKNMSRLSIYADRPPIGVSGPLLIQWTDDDYQTYNTGVSCELNQDLASIYRLGNFRQRCFKLTFSANTLFRIQGMVADINKGHA